MSVFENDFSGCISDSDLDIDKIPGMIGDIKPSFSFSDILSGAAKHRQESEIPFEKMLNIYIYNGVTTYHGVGVAAEDAKRRLAAQNRRVRDLFGVPAGHEYEIYQRGQKYIGDVLVRDAVKNNTRDFLPDELVSEYDRLVSEL